MSKENSPVAPGEACCCMSKCRVSVTPVFALVVVIAHSQEEDVSFFTTGQQVREKGEKSFLGMGGQERRRWGWCGGGGGVALPVRVQY
jgi:hypothetical protein